MDGWPSRPKKGRDEAGGISKAHRLAIAKPATDRGICGGQKNAAQQAVELWNIQETCDLLRRQRPK
jgi:hypothetical protein